MTITMACELICITFILFCFFVILYTFFDKEIFEKIAYIIFGIWSITMIIGSWIILTNVRI